MGKLQTYTGTQISWFFTHSLSIKFYLPPFFNCIKTCIHHQLFEPWTLQIYIIIVSIVLLVKFACRLSYLSLQAWIPFFNPFSTVLSATATITSPPFPSRKSLDWRQHHTQCTSYQLNWKKIQLYFKKCCKFQYSNFSIRLQVIQPRVM